MFSFITMGLWYSRIIQKTRILTNIYMSYDTPVIQYIVHLGSNSP
jgi:hypothetical protein